MRTTQDDAESALADELRQMVLQTRKTLPRARNGSPIPVSDPYAAKVRSDMQQERSAEFRRLLAVLSCDLRDGVSFSDVVAPLKQMISFLEVQRVLDVTRISDRPFGRLLPPETRAQGELDVWQIRSVETPDDPHVLTEVLRKADYYLLKLGHYTTAVERHLARVRMPASVQKIQLVRS